MPARIGSKYANEMFAFVGGLTKAGRAERALGMGPAFSAIRKQNLINYGRPVMNRAGYGLMGASGISMVASNRSTGAYKPAPVNPISSPQGSGRYA